MYFKLIPYPSLVREGIIFNVVFPRNILTGFFYLKIYLKEVPLFPREGLG
jgi:hypothetical protein